MTGRPDGFLDGFLDNTEVKDKDHSQLDCFGIVDKEVPADLNTKQDPHDWKGPFPGLTRVHNGCQLQNDNYNFKSPTIHQADTWKKGLEVVLQPNSTLVMKALTRSQKEVVPLQNSTLVMLTLKTSTENEKTPPQTWRHGYILCSIHWNITFLIGWTCDQRKLPQDQDQYWNFKESLSDKKEIEYKSFRPMITYSSSRTHQELRKHQKLETQSSERNMQEYRTSSNLQNFQTMFPELEHPALQTGNPVAPALHETGTSLERQEIPTSS